MSSGVRRASFSSLLTLDRVWAESQGEEAAAGHTFLCVLGLLHFLLPTHPRSLHSLPPPKTTILEPPRPPLQLVPMSSSTSKHPLSVQDPLHPIYSYVREGSTVKEGWAKGGKRRAKVRDQLIAGEYEGFGVRILGLAEVGFDLTLSRVRPHRRP